MKNSLEQMQALFALAYFKPLTFYKIENPYWPEDARYDSVRKESPWFLVETQYGFIKVGWRKRVLSINWESTKLEALDLTKDEVTKDKFMVHAWTWGKVVDYLSELNHRLEQRHAVREKSQAV